MKTRLTAAAIAFVLGISAPVSSAMAFAYDVPAQRVVPASPYDELTTGSVGDVDLAGRFSRCIPSSASEGNANQQARPVMQYGQTSGGSRC